MMWLVLIFGPLLFMSGITMLMGQFFTKAGVDVAKSRIPVLNVYHWMPIIDRKPWWLILMFLPYLNIILIIWMVTELLKAFGKRGLGEQALGIFFWPAYLPYLNFKADLKFEGKVEVKRSTGSEWADALLFAIVAATIIRTFVFEAYTIPTSSMEGTLLVGDFLFVSKIHYGPRIPNTPLTLPLVHRDIPFVGGKSYIESPQLPYYRLPGFQSVERNDMVVFNFPMEDDFPVDKKMNYIKRCVGLPGDKLQVNMGTLMINDEVAYQAKEQQGLFQVTYIKGMPNSVGGYVQSFSPAINGRRDCQFVDVNGLYKAYPDLKKIAEMGINLCDFTPYSATTDYLRLPVNDSTKLKALASLPYVQNIQRIIYEPNRPGAFDGGNMFPFGRVDSTVWNNDNYGPVNIPYAGLTVPLNNETWPFYARAITAYEKVDIQKRNGKFILNGAEVNEYTFKMDYYFMMGDNRHNSEDSRYWGFVPEDHIVGKAWFIWLSLDKFKGWFDGKLRWKRSFTVVSNME